MLFTNVCTLKKSEAAECRATKFGTLVAGRRSMKDWVKNLKFLNSFFFLTNIYLFNHFKNGFILG